jgi:hypothetical protein
MNEYVHVTRLCMYTRRIQRFSSGQWAVWTCGLGTSLGKDRGGIIDHPLDR